MSGETGEDGRTGPERGRRGADPALLAEVGLVLLLLVLFVALYWAPSGLNTAYRPAWWAWPLLAILFFGVLAMDVRRRRRRRHRELHEELDRQKGPGVREQGSGDASP